MAKEKSKSKKGLKLSLMLSFIVILLLILFFLIPVFICSSKGKDFILGVIDNKFDGSANYSKLSFSWFDGIEISDIHLKGSLEQITVDIKKIQANPSYLSFLTSTPNLGRTTIESPHLLLKIPKDMPKEQPEHKRPAVDEIKKQPSKTPAPALAGVFGLAKIDLSIDDGLVMVQMADSKNVSFENIAAKIKLQGENTNNQIDASAVVISSDSNIASTLTAKADIKSAKGWSLDSTSGEITVEVNNLDLLAVGAILQMTGSSAKTKGVVSVDLAGDINKGKISSLSGNIKASDLDIDISIDNSPAKRFKTSSLIADIDIAQSGAIYNINNLLITTDWLGLSAKGTAGEDFKSSFALNGDFNFNIDTAAGMMPGFFEVKENTRITGGDIKGQISAQSKNHTSRIEASAAVKGLSGISDNVPFGITENIEINFAVIPTDEVVEIENISMFSSFADISLRGNSNNINYDINADLTKMQAEVGNLFDFGGYSFDGIAKLGGMVLLTDEKIAIKGSSKITGLKVTKSQITAVEPAADIGYNIYYLKADSLLGIDNFDYKGDLGKFTVGSSSVGLSEKSDMPLNILLKADMDLAKAADLAELGGFIDKDLTVKGKLNTFVKLNKENSTISINTENTKITKPQIAYKNKDVFVQDYADLDFVGKFDTDNKTIDIEKARFISPQIKILKAQISQKTVNASQQLKGQIDYDIDLTTGSSVIDPFVPQEFNLTGRAADTLWFDSTYPLGRTDKILAGLDAKTSIGFDSAEYMGLDFGKTKVDIQFVNGLMNIKPFTTNVNNGKLSFGGSADFKQQYPVLSIAEPMAVLDKVQIDNDMAEKLLKYVNPIFANAAKAQGQANFYCKRLKIPLSQGRKQDLLIEGNISMEDIKISGGGFLSQITQVANIHNPNVNIQIMPTDFILENGQLHYDDMQINFGDNPANFTGNIYLDKAMNMTITLPWTVMGKTAKLGQDLSNRVKLPITGKADEPKLDVSQLIQQNIGNILEGLIKDR